VLSKKLHREVLFLKNKNHGDNVFYRWKINQHPRKKTNPLLFKIS
jgi:hypothetical protein